MINCVHCWVVVDDKNYHQIGQCKKCGEIKDFGINPTIATDKLIVTTDYYNNPFTSELTECPVAEDREYQYSKPPSGFCIPFEKDENDEGYWDWDRELSDGLSDLHEC